MTEHKNALFIDCSSDDERMSLAAELLEHCRGIVVLNEMITLHPEPQRILCEVIDPHPGSQRCAEEYRVLIENASRALGRSKLREKMPDRRMEWQVVENQGSSTVQVWRPRPEE